MGWEWKPPTWHDDGWLFMNLLAFRCLCCACRTANHYQWDESNHSQWHNLFIRDALSIGGHDATNTLNYYVKVFLLHNVITFQIVGILGVLQSHTAHTACKEVTSTSHIQSLLCYIGGIVSPPYSLHWQCSTCMILESLGKTMFSCRGCSSMILEQVYMSCICICKVWLLSCRCSVATLLLLEVGIGKQPVCISLGSECQNVEQWNQPANSQVWLSWQIQLHHYVFSPIFYLDRSEDDITNMGSWGSTYYLQMQGMWGYLFYYT